jgi:hypothetical protein
MKPIRDSEFEVTISIPVTLRIRAESHESANKQAMVLAKNDRKFTAPEHQPYILSIQKVGT